MIRSKISEKSQHSEEIMMAANLKLLVRGTPGIIKMLIVTTLPEARMLNTTDKV